MASPTGKLIMWSTALLILLAVGTYLVLKFRDDIDSNDSIENASDLLTKFREMRQEGHINDKEYRTIKTDLETKLSKQAPDDSDVLDRID